MALHHDAAEPPGGVPLTMGVARVSILYPARPGSRFDFGYYVPNHLPLAVGTSLRHAAITGCDASRPLNEDCAYACLCTVTFADAPAMAGFRNFFATGHPETRRILADEPNYTNITPLFVAGQVHGDADPDLAPGDAGHRVQLVIPATGGTSFDGARCIGTVAPAIAARLRQAVPLRGFSVDLMEAGVLPGSRPDCHAILTAWCDQPAALSTLRRLWSADLQESITRDLAPCTDAPVHPVFAAVSVLDMARARQVAAQE